MFATARREIRMPLLIVALLLLATLATGCGSGGGSDGGVLPVGLAAQFSGSGTAGAPNLVRLNGSSTGDLIEVEVSIGGPTSSMDLYSFAFDLVLGDPAVAEYVGGSVSVGTALTTENGQTLQVLAMQQGARITVGVTKLGGGTGNRVSETGDATVVGLVFRMLRSGATTLTIEGSPGNDPAALDSNGAKIDSVAFDAVAATLVGA